jgi:hypothetical protein
LASIDQRFYESAALLGRKVVVKLFTGNYLVAFERKTTPVSSARWNASPGVAPRNRAALTSVFVSKT